jgi:hypothetical protein
MTTIASCFGVYALAMASMRLVDYWFARRRAERIIKRIVEG